MCCRAWFVCAFAASCRCCCSVGGVFFGCVDVCSTQVYACCVILFTGAALCSRRMRGAWSFCVCAPLFRLARRWSDVHACVLLGYVQRTQHHTQQYQCFKVSQWFRATLPHRIPAAALLLRVVAQLSAHMCGLLAGLCRKQHTLRVLQLLCVCLSKTLAPKQGPLKNTCTKAGAH
jgi:hypothetical protein